VSPAFTWNFSENGSETIASPLASASAKTRFGSRPSTSGRFPCLAMKEKSPEPIVYGAPSFVAENERNGSTSSTPGTARRTASASSGILPSDGPDRPLAGPT
jgi:hypothetical protein